MSLLFPRVVPKTPTRELVEESIETPQQFWYLGLGGKHLGVMQWVACHIWDVVVGGSSPLT